MNRDVRIKRGKSIMGTRADTIERARRVSELIESDDYSVTAACEKVGISPQTYRKYVDAHDTEGSPGVDFNFIGRVAKSNLAAMDKLKVITNAFK